MNLYVLGMNGPFPEPGGATSGYLLVSGKTKIGMDLGSGTLQRLTELMEPADLDLLFFTHWHYDHCSDVLPLLYRLQASGRKLSVMGPADEASPIRAILEKDPQVHLQTAAPGDCIEVSGLRIQVFSVSRSSFFARPTPLIFYSGLDWGEANIEDDSGFTRFIEQSKRKGAPCHGGESP